MAWLYLSIAICTEIIGTILMKFTDGFTRPAPSGGVVFFYIISTIFMSMAVKFLDLSIVYVIWSGVGTAAITLVGFLYFHESFSLLKAASIGLVVAGVIGLNLASQGH